MKNSLGGIAQLGECLTGSQEVTGSSPVISTIEYRDVPLEHLCILFLNQKEITGLEGERADHREAKTVQCTVFSESADEAPSCTHAAASAADGVES